MFKQVSFMGAIGERTGYQVHASRFVEQLSKLIPVEVNKGAIPGAVHISLLDSVTVQNVKGRWPYPSILYNVWESTEQPEWFMDKLQYYNQLWVPSEWQRAASIAQGIPEEFVKVVPEGVDPEVYKPDMSNVAYVGPTFNFVHVGQWQPRKSTIEVIQSFLKAFPDNDKVRLYLSADTLFPSDNYGSTEERLKAYGLEDPRIIPVHFEERDSYIRRLQAAHCFVSCARSEGWGLPIIEAMACGIPTIVADWSGSTEYAYNAIRVPVRELIKPFGIYGNWDVPGQWCEPDYDVLVEKMRDVYKNYAAHKEDALKESENIRTKFSWEAAAKKAYSIISEIPGPAPEKVPDLTQSVDVTEAITEMKGDVEAKVRAFARAHGFEIESMRKKKIIFTMDTHPDTPEKLQCLRESIEQVKALGYPLLLTSHYPLPEDIVRMVDFHIYDKRDIMSGEDRPIYWRIRPDGTKETAMSSIPCHAVASTMNVRNGIDFCLGKYDWIYHMSSDCEVDLAEWVRRVQASTKPLIGVRWDHQENTFGGQMVAGRIDVMDKWLGRYETWEEFKAEFGDQRFNSEEGMLRRAIAAAGDEGFDILDMELGNRFDQVDREAWKDDIFQFHFVDGPFLNIVGLSKREYDVTFTDPDNIRNTYSLKQLPGMWSRPQTKYFRNWKIDVTLDGKSVFSHTLDLKGKNIMISMGSKALGDTLAWVPYVDEFRKKHGCIIYLSTWWNNILDYPELKLIKPGDVIDDIYATYEIGCYDNQQDKNPVNWRTIPLQKVAADILGLEYKPLRAKLKYEPAPKKGNGNPPKPYICFSEFSTMKNKLWNREGAWQEVIDHISSLGYDCVAISAEQSQLKGIVDHCGQSIEQTLTDLSGASFYIGLNAGPTWLAHSLGLPIVMITGVSEPFNDPPNPYRIQIDTCRPGCFNDPTLPIDRGWEWCPRKKDYACTKEIAPEMVIGRITDLLRKEITHAVEKGKVKQSGKREHKGNDDGCPSTKTSRGRSDAKCRQEQAST